MKIGIFIRAEFFIIIQLARTRWGRRGARRGGEELQRIDGSQNSATTAMVVVVVVVVAGLVLLALGPQKI